MFGKSTSLTEVNIVKVKEMVNENRHLSLRAEISVSHESIRTILNDCFVMKRVSTRLVPKDLNFLQKQQISWNNHRIHLIMAPANFILFPKLK